MMHLHIHSTMWLFVTVLTLTACGGSGSSSNSTPEPSPTVSPTPTVAPTATPTPDVTPTPTPTPTSSPVLLSEVQAEIFSPICSGCHNSEGIAADTGLFLDSETNSFNNLVNVESTGASGEIRVIPGDPENSYLIAKLEGAAGISGNRMPLGGAPLDASQMQLVRQWISDGALQTASATKLMMQKSQMKTSTLSATLYFSSVIQPQSLDDQSILIYALNGEEEFLLPARHYSHSLDQATLALTIHDAQAQSYAVHINSPDISAVYDAQGRLLDGDADGEDGGALVVFLQK